MGYAAWEQQSLHLALLGATHRVDGESPVPESMRGPDGMPVTLRAMWLRALLAEFGSAEVARWGHHRVVRLSGDAARILVNSTVTGRPLGSAGPSPWLHARASFHAVRVRWGRGPGECFWVLYAAARVGRRSVARWTRSVGSAETLRGAEVLALRSSPSCPPPGSGWTLEEWSRRP